MRTKILVVILLLIAAIVAPVRAETSRQVVVKINRQKTVVKTKLNIKFLALLEDSRCPTDAQCIQAGDARIRVEIKNGGGAAKTFELGTNEKSNAVTFAGYTIRLNDLNPHPATNIRIDRNGYAATFTVGKTGGSN